MEIFIYKWYAVWNGFENPWRIVQPGIEIECDETYLSWFDINGKSNGNVEVWGNSTEFMGLTYLSYFGLWIVI